MPERIAPLVAAALLAAGCTDLAEVDTAYSAGVRYVSSSDLTVTACSEPIEGAASLLPLPGRIWVATTGGRIVELGSDDLAEDTSWTVGAPFSAGYCEMELSVTGKSVYLVGAAGSILELDVLDGSTRDEFHLCDSPTLLVYSADSPYLYVGDAASRRVMEVSQRTHDVTRYAQLDATPICMSRTRSPESLAVGTTLGSELLSLETVGYVRRILLRLGAPMPAVTDLPGDTALCAVLGAGQSDLLVTVPLPSPEPGQHLYTGAVEVGGTAHLLCPGELGHAFLLSYLGGGLSRLCRYDSRRGVVEATVEIPGYPVDMETTGLGNLAVLTVE